MSYGGPFEGGAADARARRLRDRLALELLNAGGSPRGVDGWEERVAALAAAGGWSVRSAKDRVKEAADRIGARLYGEHG